MKLQCGCGYAGFVEAVNTNCPNCQGVMEVPRMIDLEEFRPVFEEAFEELKRSCIKHDWSKYSLEMVHEAVMGEMDEFREAVDAGDMCGQHGQLREGLQVMVVMAKMIHWQRSRDVEGL